MTPTGDPDRDLDAGLPDGCPHCGHDDLVEDNITEQWVTDFVVVPVRTRFRVHVGHCCGCGRRVQGRHPEQTSDALGAAGSQIGPHAKALALWLHYGAGLSFGRCSKALAMLGVDVTRGALTQAAAGTGKAMVPTYQALLERVAASPMVVMDETGWRIGGNSAWLWDAVTPDITVYAIAQGEGARGFDAGCGLVRACLMVCVGAPDQLE